MSSFDSFCLIHNVSVFPLSSIPTIFTPLIKDFKTSVFPLKYLNPSLISSTVNCANSLPLSKNKPLQVYIQQTLTQITE